ncbi:MAG: hypothetical protein ACREBF_00910 [Candidatus Micrarchaeales archaeon]
MAKNTKNLGKDIRKTERALKQTVLNKHYKHIVAAFGIIVGIVLLLENIGGVIYAAIGLVLIYLGLKLFGYSIPIPKME